MVVNKLFWENKKVLITGHTGFKGSWLSLCLQNMGAQIIGVSLDPPTKPSLYNQAKVASDMISLRADIRDLNTIKDIFKQYEPEIIFHLAAQPLVLYSYREPIETYQVNVMGTLNILESIRNIDSVRSVVMTTTDKCYDNREWEWGYRENESMGGHDPYSSSKGCAELLIASYRESYFPSSTYGIKHKTAISSVRAGNVIGGGDWAEDRLVPDIIRAIQENTVVNIRNPNAIRPWQHVLEPLGGYIGLAEKLYNSGMKYAEAWNFGPREDDAQSVKWIVEKMTNTWGESEGWVEHIDDHPHEANYLKLDCSKAHAKLNWWPKWSLETALEKIIEWHKKEQYGDDMKTCTLEQINSYIKANEKSQ